MQITRESINYSPNFDDIYRREQFYTEVTSMPGVGVRKFAQGPTWIPDQVNAVLAVRDEMDKFGTSQMLQGILRVGHHAYGIAKLLGPQVRGGSLAYILEMNDTDTYQGRPEFVAPLILGVDVAINDTLPSKNKNWQFDTAELTIGMSELGQLKISAPWRRYRTAQWITARTTQVTNGTQKNPLVDEINSWSMPPKFVLTQLREHDKSTKVPHYVQPRKEKTKKSHKVQVKQEKIAA